MTSSSPSESITRNAGIARAIAAVGRQGRPAGKSDPAPIDRSAATAAKEPKGDEAAEPDGTADRRPPEIFGCIDAIEGDRIFGWAWDRHNPDDRLVIEIWVDDAEAGTTIADQARGDLKENGIGDGRHAFEFRLAAAPEDSEAIRIFAKDEVAGTRIPLKRRSAAEAVADGIIGPPLRRIAGMIDGLGVAQRQFHGVQQAMLRDIKTALEKDRDSAPSSAVATALEEIRATQQALSKQMADTEVFLLRFETLLGSLAEEVRSGRSGSGDRSLRRAVMVVAGLSVVTLGLATLALLGGSA